MNNNFYLDIANPRLFQLIENGNQINKALIGLVGVLSNFMFGLIALVILVPISIVLVIFTSIISRLSLEYLYFSLKKAERKISTTDERNLMEGLIIIDDSINLLQEAQNNLKSSRNKILYSKLFFGSSLKKTLRIQSKIKNEIEEKVYPNLNKELDEEQINRLLQSYKGLELIDD